MSSDGIVKVVDKAKDQIISSKQMLSAFTPASAFKGYQGELEKTNQELMNRLDEIDGNRQ